VAVKIFIGLAPGYSTFKLFTVAVHNKLEGLPLLSTCTLTSYYQERLGANPYFHKELHLGRLRKKPQIFDSGDCDLMTNTLAYYVT